MSNAAGNDRSPYDSVPPHDLKAEFAVLGAFMADAAGTVRRRIMEILPSPKAFFLPENAAVYRAACSLFRRDIPLDEPMMREEMKNSGITWDEVRSGFADIFIAYFLIENGPRMAEVVQGHYRRRWLFKSLYDASAIAYEHASDPVYEARVVRDQLNEFIVRAGGNGTRAGGSDELDQLIDDTKSGRRRSVMFATPMMGMLSKALMPGTVSVLAGTPGDGKSFLMLASLLSWIVEGISAAVYMVEGPRKEHLNRCLAMLAEDSRVVDDDLVRTGGVPIDRYREEHRGMIEMMGECIFDTTHVDPTFGEVGAWVEQQAATKRIVVIDPISLVKAGKDRFLQDEDFMRSAMNAVERHGSSLILVTHPPKMKNKFGPITLNDISGGAVYPRAAQCVMVLQKLNEPKWFDVYDGHFTQALSANRILRILKSRGGKGSGTDLAMDFVESTFAFREYGIIKGEANLKQEVT